MKSKKIEKRKAASDLRMSIKKIYKTNSEYFKIITNLTTFFWDFRIFYGLNWTTDIRLNLSKPI